MEKIKRVLGLLRVNWRTMAEFELLYKLLSLAVFTPVFWGIFHGIMKITGYEYLTIENILSFFINPLTSAALGRTNKLKDLAALLGVQLALSVIFFAAAMLGIGLAVLLGGLFTRLRMVGIVSASVVWVYLAVSLLILSAFGTPVSYACISILFYGHKADKQEKVIHGRIDGRQEKERSKKIRYAMEGIALLLAVVCCCFYLYGIYDHKISVQIAYVRTMEVTAHRGASASYPENTMAAFEGAKKLGADWIELDVQQSRDGQTIVTHDTNFTRTAGVDRNTWEMDYDEIKLLDVGSFFDGEFHGEGVPLLSEAVAFAKKNDIRLNIEIKPTGHEQELEQRVAEMIAAERFWDQCVITSQVYDVLEKVKACDSRIQTAYVMSIAYGDINKLAAADHFSIETSGITETMVSDIHNAGKEIYAWTVNTEESISRMIDLCVDNIITDQVTLAKECIYLSKTSDVVSEYVKWLSQ